MRTIATTTTLNTTIRHPTSNPKKGYDNRRITRPGPRNRGNINGATLFKQWLAAESILDVISLSAFSLSDQHDIFGSAIIPCATIGVFISIADVEMGIRQTRPHTGIYMHRQGHPSTYPLHENWLRVCSIISRIYGYVYSRPGQARQTCSSS